MWIHNFILLIKGYILHFKKSFRKKKKCLTPLGMILWGVGFFEPKIRLTQQINRILKKPGGHKSCWTVPSKEAEII